MRLIRAVKNRLLNLLDPARIAAANGSSKRAAGLIDILDKGLGHENSFLAKKPIDANDNPVPWFTYPAIAYLQQIDFSRCSVLEWGVGYSTLFFAPLCKEIISIEHSPEWYNTIMPILPGNSTVKLLDGNAYELYPKDIETKFDVIIVDGIRRWECVQVAVEVLQEDGVIIFDNSDRDPEYCAFLRAHNFIQVDFHGFGPINDYTWTTSIFFTRTNNLQPKSIQPLIPVGGGF